MARQTPDGWQPPERWDRTAKEPAQCTDEPARKKRRGRRRGKELDYHEGALQRIVAALNIGWLFRTLVSLLPIAPFVVLGWYLWEESGQTLDVAGVAALFQEPEPLLGSTSLEGQSGSRTWRGAAPYETKMAACNREVVGAPQLAIEVLGPTYVTLSTESGADLLLILRPDEGKPRCDDDTGPGKQPRLALPLDTGRYRVWVAQARSARRLAPFSLTVHWERLPEMPGPGGLMPTAEPSLGAWRPADTPDGEWHGEVVPDFRYGGDEETFLSPRPHLRIETETPVAVELAVEGPRGSRIVIRGPDGEARVHAGRRIVHRQWVGLGPGAHALWVGLDRRAASEAAPVPFALRTHAVALSAVPEPDGLAEGASPLLESVELTPADERRTWRTEVRGLVGVSLPGCDGWVDPSPHLRGELSEPTRLTVRAAGAGVVVRHADGQVSCDGGTGARVRSTFPAGAFEVWLTAEQPNRARRARLVLEPAPVR